MFPENFAAFPWSGPKLWPFCQSRSVKSLYKCRKSRQKWKNTDNVRCYWDKPLFLCLLVSLYVQFCVSVSLCVCQSIYVCLCVSSCRLINQSVRISLSCSSCLSSLSLCLSVSFYFGPSVSVSVCLFVCLSVCLSASLSVCLSVCLYVTIVTLRYKTKTNEDKQLIFAGVDN